MSTSVNTALCKNFVELDVLPIPAHSHGKKMTQLVRIPQTPSAVAANARLQKLPTVLSQIVTKVKISNMAQTCAIMKSGKKNAELIALLMTTAFGHGHLTTLTRMCP